MTTSIRKLVITASSGALIPTLIYFILISHQAWGDERYVLKEEAIIEQISRIDLELNLVDIEILYAETPKLKEKWRTVKAQYERDKEKRQEQLKKLN